LLSKPAINKLSCLPCGSAWFAQDDARRDTLATANLADVAVLSKDYLNVPVD
jgi:hypothetical protein